MGIPAKFGQPPHIKSNLVPEVHPNLRVSASPQKQTDLTVSPFLSGFSLNLFALNHPITILQAPIQTFYHTLGIQRYTVKELQVICMLNCMVDSTKLCGTPKAKVRNNSSPGTLSDSCHRGKTRTCIVPACHSQVHKLARSCSKIPWLGSKVT